MSVVGLSVVGDLEQGILFKYTVSEISLYMYIFLDEMYTIGKNVRSFAYFFLFF